jgi:hypothetical protein
VNQTVTDRSLEQAVTTLAWLDRMAGSVVADAEASRPTGERAIHELAAVQAIREQTVGARVSPRRSTVTSRMASPGASSSSSMR